MRFRDRRDAGARLGKTLAARAFERPIVIGLPRGGVPVAAEVAAALGVPLEVWLVRKLGVPFQPELGMGAIAEGPAEALGITNAQMLRRERSARARGGVDADHVAPPRGAPPGRGVA